MAKWADYLISQVKRNSSGVVTEVMLYEDNGDTITKIGVKTKDEVINLLKRGKTVCTILWDYPTWLKGAEVSYLNNSNGEYLRTNRNSTDKDNLDNLFPL
ncbi:DUF3892 domain-containing protein [Flavobacterium psychrophilum]|nr:DUF3892 domain-containing protein [Flavobacterium psychrophilum]